MTIDGFSLKDADAFRGMSPRAASLFYRWVERLGHRLGVIVEGVEHVPAGRALLVANHAFGFDSAFPMEAIRREKGRLVWALGEHAWWRLPFLRKLASGIGVVDGTQANADRLLAAEQLVLVLPGGLREAMKPKELRYRLLWGKRFGFVRAAIRNRAPVVPVAAIGSEEIFELVGDPFARGKRLLGRFAFPLPRPSYGLPIPHRVALRFVIGEPIVLQAAPCDADDPEALRHCRHEIEGALQELIDLELARRAGFPVDAPEHR